MAPYSLETLQISHWQNYHTYWKINQNKLSGARTHWHFANSNPELKSSHLPLCLEIPLRKQVRHKIRFTASIRCGTRNSWAALTEAKIKTKLEQVFFWCGCFINAGACRAHAAGGWHKSQEDALARCFSLVAKSMRCGMRPPCSLARYSAGYCT